MPRPLDPEAYPDLWHGIYTFNLGMWGEDKEQNKQWKTNKMLYSLDANAVYGIT